MGTHEVVSRTEQAQMMAIAPNGFRYTLAKKLCIAEDIKAGYSLSQVCARHGISKATASAIKNDQQLNDMIDPEMVDRRRKSMAAIYEYQADMALSTLTPERWEKERPSSVMISAATATDKSRLLRGESTENVSMRGVVDSFSQELRELKKKREQLFGSVQQNGQLENSAEEAKVSTQESTQPEN